MKKKLLAAFSAILFATAFAMPAEAADKRHSHYNNRPVKVVKSHPHKHHPRAAFIRYYTPQRYVTPFYHYGTPVRYSYGYGHNHSHNHHNCRR
jgi:hypothetical protein